jgi:hypothetical protein
MQGRHGSPQQGRGQEIDRLRIFFALAYLHLPARLEPLSQFFRIQFNVAEDFAQQSWTDIPAFVNRDRRLSAVGMLELLVAPRRDSQ